MCNENCWFQHFRDWSQKKQSRTKCGRWAKPLQCTVTTDARGLHQEEASEHSSSQPPFHPKTSAGSLPLPPPLALNLLGEARSGPRTYRKEVVEEFLKGQTLSSHLRLSRTESPEEQPSQPTYRGQKTPPYHPGKLQKLLRLALHHLSPEQVKNFLLCPSLNYDWIHDQA